MEWLEIIQSIINSLGFPILCVIACGLFIYKDTERDKDEARERENRLIEANLKNADALSKVADALNNNNNVISELSCKLDKLDSMEDAVNKVIDILDK